MYVDSINTTDLNTEIDTLSFALAVHVGTHPYILSWSLN